MRKGERVTTQQMPTGFLGVLAVVRFLAELSMLVALGWVGWALPDPLVLSVILAVLLPLSGATLWGLWVAPRASRRLADPARFAVEIIPFAVALLGLLRIGSRGALAFAAVLLVAYLASAWVGRKGF